MNRHERRAAVSGRARSPSPTRAEHRVRRPGHAGPSAPCGRKPEDLTVDDALITMQTISFVASMRLDGLKKSIEAIDPGDEMPPSDLVDHVLGLVSSSCDRYDDARSAADSLAGTAAISDLLNAALVLRRILALDGACDCARCQQIRDRAAKKASEKSS